MRLIHITGDDIAKVENCKIKRGEVELSDGNHPFDGRYIWTHRHHTAPPIAIYWEGILEMEGAVQDLKGCAKALNRHEVSKLHNRPLKASRLWVRSLIHWMLIFLKTFMIASLTMLWGLVVWFLVVL